MYVLSQLLLDVPAICAAASCSEDMSELKYEVCSTGEGCLSVYMLKLNAHFFLSCAFLLGQRFNS